MKAEELRKQGLTYKEIGRRLGISEAKAWIVLNRERHRKNQRESQQKYYKRNKTPLCDVPKDQLYDVYVFGKKVE